MTEASVGFQCPDCVNRGRGPTVRSRLGAPVSSGRSSAAGRSLAGLGFDVWSATVLLVAARVLIAMVSVPTGGRVQALLMMSSPAVASGEYWRLITSSLTSFSLLGLVINSMFLLFVGRGIESELGRWRMLVSYLLCGLGGSTVFFLVAPASATGGDTAALVGVLALYAMTKWRRGEDVRGDLLLVGLLVAMGLFAGPAYLLGLAGGALTGAVTGLALTATARRRQAERHWLIFAAIALVCLALVAARVLLG